MPHPEQPYDRTLDDRHPVPGCARHVPLAVEHLVPRDCPYGSFTASTPVRGADVIVLRYLAPTTF
ncbi:hypothetical protein [Actinomadura madurae]|uniref:hypothetical protein n=1 Tax=Actinomadura madurae TaxID=1993 RepID=UPI000D84B323|nr:hypothetical protein [Actinomadura madurae]SPT51505.1 Uncharacterised protein [Actinomadura madurae]